jgi:hypothetical protein
MHSSTRSGSPGETFFAPAGRAAPNALRDQVGSICSSPITAFLLSSLNGYVAILNEQRQILAASPELLGALGPRWDGPKTGARPGEAFECIHAEEGPDGCGTSLACSQCGMVVALMNTMAKGEVTEGEWHLSMLKNGTWKATEFHVAASPLQVGEHRFLATTFHDISAEKHRDALERLFFHDIGNILQGLQGWSESLADGITRPEEAAWRILRISERLSHEVHSHRRLLQAERGLLTVAPTTLDGGSILQELVLLLERHPAAQRRQLLIQPIPEPAAFASDSDLLLRVLYNMALNGLEATQREDPISMAFAWQGAHPHFTIHNPGYIPTPVRLQIFQRAFSTKGTRGRGLGTYAMKLFGENLLKGRVGFDSTEEAGTSFWITLPPSLESA